MMVADRICPACGHSGELGATFCSVCGTKLPPVAGWPDATVESPIEETQAIEAPATIEVSESPPTVPHDLGPFPPRAEEPPPPAPPARRFPWPTVASALGVAAMVGAALFVVASVRYRRVPFPLAAWAFASVPIGYAMLRGMRDRKRGGRGPALFAGAFAVVVLAATTVLVLRSCEPRLGPRANLAGCDFSELNLAGRDLRGTNLTDANLSGTDLSGANLEGAKLAKSDLSGASLAGANLNGANLDDVTLSKTTLTGATFERAHMANVVLAGVTPQGLKLKDSTLTGADLSGTNLDRVDLRGAVLDDANLFNTSLASADLTDASLIAAELEGTRLLEANMSSADLSKARITGADLTRARLDAAIFTDATLTKLKMAGATLIGATGLPDDKLAGALQVGLPALAGKLSEQDIRLEERDAILSAMGVVCSGRGPVPHAAPHAGGGLHPLVITTADGKPSLDFGDDAAALHWEPMATRFGQLVACVGEERQVSLQVCRYRDDAGRPADPITRYEHRRKIRVLEARTGKVVEERTVAGSPPDFCPLRTNLGTTRIDGGDVTFADLEAVLAPLVK